MQRTGAVYPIPHNFYSISCEMCGSGESPIEISNESTWIEVLPPTFNPDTRLARVAHVKPSVPSKSSGSSPPAASTRRIKRTPRPKHRLTPRGHDGVPTPRRATPQVTARGSSHRFFPSRILYKQLLPTIFPQRSFVPQFSNVCLRRVQQYP